MPRIESGRAFDLGTKFWVIRDSNDVAMTKFNHARFKHIFHESVVYFMDLDLDPRQCENVQSEGDVESRVLLATPSKGIHADAEEALRQYVMSALLTALMREGRERSKYLGNLDMRLTDIAARATASNQSVDMALLKRVGIVS